MLDQIADLHDSPEEEFTFITEPIVRPDGYTVAVVEQKAENEDPSFIVACLKTRLEHGAEDRGITASYSSQEVEMVGKGNFDSGILKLGRFFFELPSEQFDDYYEHHSLTKIIGE